MKEICIEILFGLIVLAGCIDFAVRDFFQMATTLLTLDDAAEFLSISRRTLTRYRARPDFPKVIPVSRTKVYLVKEELVKWVRSYRTEKKK